MLENLAYLEPLFVSYRHDPNSVPPPWRSYFASLNGDKGPQTQIGPSFGQRSVFNPAGRSVQTAPDPYAASLHERLQELIRNHRTCGHLIAAVDPLGAPRSARPELEPAYYAFTPEDLKLLVTSSALPYNTPLTLGDIFQRLRETYCRSIGVQFMHIDDPSVRNWLQERMESTQNHLELSHAEQLRILTRLADATIFDEFLRKKFAGAKTFSLEGCETLLPLLDLVIEKAGSLGVRDIVVGMAHRGRLNVLAHIAGKDPCAIFREFADPAPGELHGRGDVKHHLGHSSDWITAAGEKIHISLCFNPSHLEFVNPIALGRTRARQDRLGDHERRQVLCLLIHGDASFAGEGVVQETLNLSQLEGYAVGGTVHVIVNNQIGFTTPPAQGRSTPYATDVARMLQVPIFHVNGEDPRAVAQVVGLSLEFRHEFKNDVFIDMYGYRRWGHNETDEPSFTQPLLYQEIAQRKSVLEHYAGCLKKMNGTTDTDVENIARERREKLESDLSAAHQDNCPVRPQPRGVWNNYSGGLEPADEVETGIPAERIAALLRKLVEVPESFHPHPKLQRAMQARREMAEGKHPLDWAAAEALALATLATDGVRIRLAGQDSGRGTFSHRHAILYDHEDGLPFVPLQNLSPDQAPVEIVNSPLSETGALGFEYGYSLDYPDGLVLWEAQFGDFVNVAQVILDQFICSAEDKWQRLSGLVLLLPHGFEGMGPEHSSARLERFFELAARDNIQMVQPTTPAQYFHVLRRQSGRHWRKPLIIFTPKSLLRHPRVVSPLSDFEQGSFQRIIPDERDPKTVRRILLCTGKIFYDLAAYREEHQRDDVALVRLEQLYPLRDAALEKLLQPYDDGTPVLWVQEEPANMGAWRFLHEKFGKHLFGRLPFAPISRPESASPAAGSAAAHKLEQKNLVGRAFGVTGAITSNSNSTTKTS